MSIICQNNDAVKCLELLKESSLVNQKHSYLIPSDENATTLDIHIEFKKKSKKYGKAVKFNGKPGDAYLALLMLSVTGEI